MMKVYLVLITKLTGNHVDISTSVFAESELAVKFKEFYVKNYERQGVKIEIQEKKVVAIWHFSGNIIIETNKGE